MNKLLKSKRFWIAAVLIFAIVCILIPSENESQDTVDPSTVLNTEVADSPTDSAENSDAEVAEQATSEAIAIEYDRLQTIFLSISDSSTTDELLELIGEYDLAYTETEYVDTVLYKVAYTDDVAKESHASDGDCLKVSFNEDGTLNYAEYFNDELFVAAFYHYEKSEYDYSYTDYSTSPVLRDDGSKSGITKTNYYEAESSEDALISALSME